MSPEKLERMFASRQMRSKEVKRLAVKCGMGIETGGREGIYLIASSGARWPLTSHGGKDLATGTLRAALGFIQQNAIAPMGTR